ncbi:MAG: SixA phosphatase family protein [Nocardioidaceae bacterium]
MVLRHAKSDWSGGEADLARPLAKRGRRQAPVTGRWLSTNIAGIDLAVVSPAARTRRTWELVSAELEATPPMRIDDRVYAASAEELLAVTRDLPDDVGTVVLVGHNPGVEDLVARLTGERVQMLTSAVAVVVLPGPWATAGDGPATLSACGRPPVA